MSLLQAVFLILEVSTMEWKIELKNLPMSRLDVFSCKNTECSYEKCSAHFSEILSVAYRDLHIRMFVLHINRSAHRELLSHLCLGTSCITWSAEITFSCECTEMLSWLAELACLTSLISFLWIVPFLSYLQQYHAHLDEIKLQSNKILIKTKIKAFYEKKK